MPEMMRRLDPVTVPSDRWVINDTQAANGVVFHDGVGVSDEVYHTLSGSNNLPISFVTMACRFLLKLYQVYSALVQPHHVHKSILPESTVLGNTSCVAMKGAVTRMYSWRSFTTTLPKYSFGNLYRPTALLPAVMLFSPLELWPSRSLRQSTATTIC